MPDIQDYWRSLSDEEHRIASEALEKSIQHWRENVEAEELEDASVRGADCALCQKFKHCERCPVAYVADADCDETPYYKASNAYEDWWYGFVKRQTFTEAAQAELDFLISLRPKEKRE